MQNELGQGCPSFSNQLPATLKIGNDLVLSDGPDPIVVLPEVRNDFKKLINLARRKAR